MNLFPPAFGTYAGMRVVEDINCANRVEDWSGVRSLGRARRRAKRGHPQRVVVRLVPWDYAVSIGSGRVMTMHPEFARKLRAATLNLENPRNDKPF